MMGNIGRYFVTELNCFLIFEVNRAHIVLQVHMFDIDVPGGIKFTESDILSPGNNLQMFEIGMMLIN